MSLTEKKREIIRQIEDTEDAELIHVLKSVLASRKKSWFDSLPEKAQESFKRGLEQDNRGEGVPHEIVMAEFRKRRKK